MLDTRTLGTQGLAVSAIGLGLMGMSHAYGTDEERDERESIATIHRAVELGCTFLDTAEVYGPFVNEELLARARAKFQQLRHREALESPARLGNPGHVLPDDSGIDLADRDKRVAGPMIDERRLVQALVGPPTAQRG